MRLFIAKLSVYANCVPRSQRFRCRIKTFLLFNAKSLPPWAGVYFPLWLLNTAQQFGEPELGWGGPGGPTQLRPQSLPKRQAVKEAVWVSQIYGAVLLALSTPSIPPPPSKMLPSKQQCLGGSYDLSSPLS